MMISPTPAIASAPSTTRVAASPVAFGSLSTTALSSATPILQAATIAMALTVFALGVQGAVKGGFKQTNAQQKRAPVLLDLGWNGLPRPQTPQLDTESGELQFFHAGRMYIVKAT